MASPKTKTRRPPQARRLDPDAIPEVAGWLHMVERGEIVACEEQHQLCELVRRIFATEDLVLDRERLDRYLGYQRYFPFDLDEPETFMLTLMLCVYTPRGIPRFKTLFLYVGRGFGKNGFITFLTFCMLSDANGIKNYDVHVIATTEDQAKTSFTELHDLLEERKDYFSRGFSWTKEEIKSTKTMSVFKFLTSNAASKDGGRPGAVILDEEHAYQSKRTMNTVLGGLGKKPDARVFKITTDGEVREGPLDDDKRLAADILNGKEPDNRTLPMVFKLDHVDEIHDERMWAKANPRVLRSDVLMQEYRDDYREWLRNPAANPEVPTKRFNCPQQRKDIAVTSWENLERASRDVGDLSGLPCVLGIDYALSTDMLGACLLFHRGDEYQAIAHAWWCTHSVDAELVKAPLDEWAEMGLVTIVDDVDIQPSLPCQWAADVTAELGSEIVMAALDNYRLTLVKGELLNTLGLDSSKTGDEKQVYVVRPSDQMRIYPVINSAFVNGSIAWGESPLMRWCTNNAKAEPAPNNNWKYGKIEPRSRKTDAFMAFVAAMCVADRIPDAPDYSGLLSLEALTY